MNVSIFPQETTLEIVQPGVSYSGNVLIVWRERVPFGMCDGEIKMLAGTVPILVDIRLADFLVVFHAVNYSL